MERPRGWPPLSSRRGELTNGTKICSRPKRLLYVSVTFARGRDELRATARSRHRLIPALRVAHRRPVSPGAWGRLKAPRPASPKVTVCRRLGTPQLRDRTTRVRQAFRGHTVADLFGPVVVRPRAGVLA